MNQKSQWPVVPSWEWRATRSTPMVRSRPLSIWWGLVVLLCLCTGFIGGVIGSCLTIGVIANRWLDRMQSEISSQTTVSTCQTATSELQADPVDPIGLIPDDPDPGELPDDEYLCESVEIVILPIGGTVWQLAQEVDKDQNTRVDWDALLQVCPDEVARTLQAGAIIAIPIKGKLGPLATKIAYGD